MYLGEKVRGTAEEAPNATLDAQVDRLCSAGPYESSEGREDTSARQLEQNAVAMLGESIATRTAPVGVSCGTVMAGLLFGFGGVRQDATVRDPRPGQGHLLRDSGASQVTISFLWASFRRRYGTEFVAPSVRDWISAVGATTAYTKSGSPWENGYNESFNARFRDKLLNGEIFYTLREAQGVIGEWRRHCNTVRPLRALGWEPPAPEPSSQWTAAR